MLLLLSLGTCDYKQALDLEGWAYSYINFGCKAPEYYPNEFYLAATEILRSDMNMEKSDINEHNAKAVYLHLLNVFDQF